MHSTRRPSLSLVLFAPVLVALVLPACTTGPSKEDSTASRFAPAPDPNAGPPDDHVPVRPWTLEFVEPAVLVAEEVRIEGPPGLLDHVATRVDPLVHEQEVRTLREGLRQVFTFRKPSSPEQAAAWLEHPPLEIRAWLDGLEVVVTEKLTVLERPGGEEVAVTARGNTFWKAVGAPDERRGPSIELVGRVEPPEPPGAEGETEVARED